MSDISNVRTFETPYGRLSVDMSLDKKMGQNFEQGIYHQEDTISLLTKFLSSSSVVVDIGAHIGSIAIPLARIAKKVIAFEPGPQTFVVLQRNIEQNNLLIDARNRGLGEHRGLASVSSEIDTNAGANSLTVGQGHVEISTLDEEVEHADLLKIDVEGMEASVLQGGRALLERSHPTIFCEINLSALRAHNSSPALVANILRSHGYDLYIPLQDKQGNVRLGTVRNLGLLTLFIAPRSWLLRSRSSTFDILAVTHQTQIPVTTISAFRTLLRIMAENVAQKGHRLRRIFKHDATSTRKNIKKAVTLRASSIGDALMAKYFLENIHAAYPEAQCALFVAGKSGMIKDLLKAYSWITVVEANSRRLDSILRAFRLLYPSDATSTQYSGRGQFSSASKLFARLVTRRGRLIGFSDPWKFNAAVFDTVIPFTMRRAMRLLECDALEALGIEPTIQEITLRSKEDTGVVDRLGLTKHRYLILNLFSGSTKRGLSLEYQINLTRALQENIDREKKIILTGSAADAPILAQIKEVVPGVMLAPALSLQDLIVLVEQSGGVVSLDTGVGHIAAQVGAPLVILRTCWGYQWWTKDQYPRDDIQVFSREDLCASGHTNKDFPDCLNEISTEDVATAAQKYFKL